MYNITYSSLIIFIYLNNNNIYLKSNIQKSSIKLIKDFKSLCKCITCLSCSANILHMRLNTTNITQC